MNTQEIRKTVERGGRVYGSMIVSPSPHWPAYLAGVGMDFAFLDTEHVCLDREMLSWMCRAYGAMNIAPIVRIPRPDPFAATQALDGGAAGVVAPYVETADEVRALVGAVKLRPLKGKKLQDVLTGTDRSPRVLREYIARRNSDNLLIVNIESVPAIEALDEILAVPGLDGILIGPHDLSCSLGIPEDYGNRRFTAALRTIVRKSVGRGLIAGVHFMGCGPVARAAQWLRMGIQLQIQHADAVYVARGLADDIGAMRKAMGDGVARGRKESIVI